MEADGYDAVSSVGLEPKAFRQAPENKVYRWTALATGFTIDFCLWKLCDISILYIIYIVYHELSIAYSIL